MSNTATSEALASALPETAPLLEPAPPPAINRRRLLRYGLGAGVVIVLQLVAVTLVVPPWAEAESALTETSGIPNILIAMGRDDASGAEVSDRASQLPVTTDVAAAGAVAATAPAQTFAGADVQAADAGTSLADAVATTSSASAGASDKHTWNGDAEDPANADERDVGASDDVALARVLNDALPDVAPMPSPPSPGAAYYPRPQARPAHILVKQSASSVAVARKVSAHKVPVQKVPARKAAALDDSWLTRQPRAHFTLQMVSVADGLRFKQFARNVPASPYMAHVQVVKSGARRHVLYRGVYSDRGAAEREADKLAQITGVKPWIRRIDDVLKEAARGV